MSGVFFWWGSFWADPRSAHAGKRFLTPFSRRAITLVELLVVISILVLLAAIAIPAMQPALEGRRIREAARAINVYCGSARNRAKELGRPCGVLIERFDTLPECAMVLKQAEVPPPYAGDTLDAAAQVQIVVLSDSGAELRATMTPPIDPSLVQNGDLVQFNHQGPLYTVTSKAPGGTWMTLWIDLGQGQLLPWPTEGPSPPVPYKIIRQPMVTAASPLQLPAGAVIDLEASGSDLAVPTLKWPQPVAPDDDISGALQVIVMFSPNGSVDRLIYYQQVPNPLPPPPTHIYGRREVALVGPLFLLVGKRERVEYGPFSAYPPPNVPPLEELPNWTDLTNLWITLNPQTGLVATTENAKVDLPAVDWRDPTTWPPYIENARDFARQAQSMGGR